MKDTLEKFSRGGPLRASWETLQLQGLASRLLTVRTLPGFSVEVSRPRVRNIREFEKVEYMIYVATEGVRAGCEVEFITPHSRPEQRTPDLKFAYGELEVHAECKRKDAHRPELPPSQHVEQITQALLTPDLEPNEQRELLIFVAGRLEPNAVEPMIEFARSLLEQNCRGLHYSPELNSTVLIRNPPPTPNGVEGVWLPSDLAPAESIAGVQITSDGRNVVRQQRTASLYVLDSHRLGSVMHNFGDALGQLRSDAVGLIYIDLDVSHVRRRHVEVYLELVRQALNRRLLTNPIPHLAGLALATRPRPWPVVRNGIPDTQLRREILIGRNPHSVLPRSFIIPGEVQRYESSP